MTNTTQEELPKCELCGEPMPPGETMFKYHGYSGSCPKPPLPRKDDLLSRGQSIWQRLDPAIEDPVGTGLASKWIAEALSCIATLKAENEKLGACVRGLESDNDELEYSIRQQESAYKARAEAAQSQAAAMAGLLVDARPYIYSDIEGAKEICDRIDAALAAIRAAEGEKQP